MTIPCPSCKVTSIKNGALLRSASGIGPNPKCSACGARWSVSSRWQGNFMGFVLLAVAFAGASSVKERSLLPYLLLPIAFLVAVCVVCKYAKPKLVEPIPFWLKLLHYAVLVLFLIVLAKFVISF